MDVYVARQPIFDQWGEVIAYELLYRETEQNYYQQTLQDSVATSILLLNSYFNFGMTLLTDSKKGFINFGPELIIEDIPKLLSKDKVVIELLESVKPSTDLLVKLKELKTLGYIIALDDYVLGYPYDNLLDLCDIIKVDFRENNDDDIRIICRQLKHKNKILLAEKVETIEEYTWAKKLGFEFFQGYFFARPTVIKSKKLEGTAYHFIQIMDELNQTDPDFSKISNIIETESTLSYKLLRLVNSSFSLIDDISSIQHCISILGIDAFQKWFTLATLHQLSQNKPNELLKLAMIRMKFMESIGTFSIFKQHINSLRLIGILSIIDCLLDKTMFDALEQLPVSSQIKETLLNKSTLYSTTYQLVLSYEKGDFVQAKKIADEIRLDFNLFPDIYVDAIKWSEDVFQNLSR